jgi:hypothetical protein
VPIVQDLRQLLDALANCLKGSANVWRAAPIAQRLAPMSGCLCQCSGIRPLVRLAQKKKNSGGLTTFKFCDSMNVPRRGLAPAWQKSDDHLVPARPALYGARVKSMGSITSISLS